MKHVSGIMIVFWVINYGTIPYFERLCINVSYIVVVFGFCYFKCPYGWLCNTDRHGLGWL